MVDFWCQKWKLPLLLCLTGLLQWDLCSGQIQVQIQEGPLYRVKGYPISISCNTTGFTGPSERDFDFILKKQNMEINIISTSKEDFSYGMFSGRIRNKEIYVVRLSGSSVVLWIKDLQESDAGDLLCATLHTGGAYYGDYDDEAKLNVIADTLEASYSGSPSQSLSEGDPLQLECQVSSQTFQHTHLSVTWFLHDEDDKNPRPIITLDKDLTVKPGAGFEDRYRAGLISMDKVEDTTYRLKMPQVQQSDQGKFFCKAIEWIQDPDRSWTQIAHKTTTACDVEIKRIEVAPEAGSFSVNLKASKGPLQEGDALDIRCSVNAQNLPGHFFSVTWLKDQQRVAQIGSSGVLTVFDSYKERENAAEMIAVKTSHMDYLLTIRSARTEDLGQYQCEVWQENMNADGTFKKLQKQMSSPETVSITAKESNLAVVMLMKEAVTEGDALHVSCSVSGFKGPLSVSWQHKKDPGASFSDVVSVTHEGVMKDVGARYQSRNVQTFHSPAGNFTLQLGASSVSDSGEYKCIVSEWTVQSNGEMKAITQSQQKAIKVNSVESLMVVSLTSRTSNVPIDSSVQLLCRVRVPKVSLALRWMFQPHNSTVQTNILSISHTGEMEWRADQRNYQLNIQAQPGDTRFTLMVPRASKQQEGQYQCQVDAYQKDVQKAFKNSNLLAVIVHKPDSKMSLFSPTSRLETTVDTDAKLECSVTRTTTNTSRFTVTWMFGSQVLLTMDLDAVVKFGPAAGLEMDQRIRLEIRQKQNFQMTIQQVRTSDSGQYHCEVEEWLQDPLGDWYSLKKMSVTTELVVKEKASDFKMNKADTQLKVEEGKQVKLKCSVEGIGSDPTLRYSLTWMFNQYQSSSSALLTYSHDGLLKYKTFDSELVGRLHFYTPEVGVFHLTIHRSIQEDRGRYYCEVQQYQLDCKGQWSLKARDKSGFTNVTVQLIENKLQVNKEEKSLTITNLQAGFTIDCVIKSRSSDTSVFEVTWSRGLINERPVIIFNASRDGTLHSAIDDKELVFGRPSAMRYKLTVPNVKPTDTGLYHCQVVEWIQTAANKWRSIGQDISGKISVHVDTEDQQKNVSFTMDKEDNNLDIKEGEKFDLECSLNVEKDDPTHHYSLRWVFNRPGSTSGIPLLSYSHDGRLQYHTEYQDRLHFSRPNSDTFHLAVLNSDKADSGSYQCRVEQYQHDCYGQWKQMARAQSGTTTVTVRSIESKLRVQKDNQMLNITNHQTSFTIDCVIDSQSSDTSGFEVTWFKVQEEGPLTMFSARRDGTLHSAISEKNLLFGRPLATHFKLTVPQISFTDMGQYYCQVEEWLLTANTWKKLSSDKSGELSIYVHTEESKLHVQKNNRMINITNDQTSFTIDCVIDSQSSDTSGFEVTWFKVQEEGPLTMFSARHDGTLHSAIPDKNLLFGRPLATHYKLTVLQISPTDIGQYYCQVEEWLLTANTWKKLASDKSGELSIYVHTEGDSEKQTDPLGTALGVTIPLICFLVLVIILLLIKDHKRDSELKKKKECLWAENNPLTPLPERTCATEDYS
ncbi:immunoglobulin superfamily member 2 isoform X2 [Carassius gibelio]|uniref:immunoglobulin superfamily member 2 isoform X2 n=1 Tax=Carassius gibelio TaxID=101364 RepID=UPI0022795DCA|nr:immunoglobulin superfamily member 2 isoform X2 [Carassius gibelio]